MGEQRRRQDVRAEYRWPPIENRHYFNTRSFHEITLWHRAMRGRYRARAYLETLYGETRVYKPTVRSLTPENLLPSREPPSEEAFKRWRLALVQRREDRLKTLYGRLLEAQGGICYLCDRALSAENPATEDHVWPKARGGQDRRNILFACSPCNNVKADRVPTPAEMEKLRDIYGRVDGLPKKTFVCEG